MEFSSLSIAIMVAIGAIVLFALGIMGLFKAFYTKVPQGMALIVNDLSSTPKVTFTGSFVIPVIHKCEIMKISLITFDLDRRGNDGLICKDNIRADISVAFYLRVDETPDAVLEVAKAVGVNRASDKEAVTTLFSAKFSEALKTVGKQIDFVKLFEDRVAFRDKIKQVIGNDLNGYRLEDVAIDYLEQTPKQHLDSSNILDAEGIRKITELTASQNIYTNELTRNEELAIKKKNVETQEAMLALERQEAEATAKQQREIDTLEAKESSLTAQVKEEERLKVERVRIETEQELSIQEENKQRDIEVAEQNRFRAIAIEKEKVQRAQELESVSRERDVELQRIEKEKALEQERKDIANVVRERIAVDKTVAEEEERIKAVREVSEAERHKQIKILDAQAKAEEELVQQVQAAKAKEETAKFSAIEMSTMAQAELEASSKQAEAKKRLAEGIQAERAAQGLAEAKIIEAKAAAMEKEGFATATIQREKMLAEAQGNEAKGLADAKVFEAHSLAKEKQGLIEAKVLEEKLGAEAQGEADMGLAQAKATREKGLVEAEITREKLRAESEGLIEKFKAMDSMSDTARQHEEFRLRLETEFEQSLASIEASKEISRDQAQTLSAAFSKAKIDIVNGDGDFFNSYAKSLSFGKAVNGVMEKSPFLQETLSKLITTAANSVGKKSTANGSADKSLNS